MTLTWSILIAFLLVAILSILMAGKTSKAKPTIHSFFWGDSHLPPRLSTHLLLSASFSLNGMLYQVWLGYAIGWWALLMQGIWCCGFLFMAANVGRLAKVVEKGTMHGLIGQSFGAKAEQAAALASIVGLAAILGWEITIGASLVGDMLHIQSVSILLCLMLPCLAALYTIRGGLRGNVNANVMQNIFKAVVFVIAGGLFLYLPQAAPISASLDPATSKGFSDVISTLTWVGLVTNTAFCLVWQFVDMSAWQNIAATQALGNQRRNALFLGAFWAFLFPGVIGTLIGIGMSGLGGVTDSNILSLFLQQFLTQPIILFLLFMAAAATMLSNVDGISLASAQAYTWDLTLRERVKKLLSLGADRVATKDDATVLRHSKWALAAIALFGTLGIMGLVYGLGIALFQIVYFAIVAQMTLAVPILWALFSKQKRKRKGGFAAIIGGLSAGFAACLYGIQSSQYDFFTAGPLVSMFVCGLILFTLNIRKPGQQ